MQDERYRALVRKLVDTRRELAISQTVLAQRLERHQQFVSRYETGERRLDIVEFIDVARHLGLDPSRLVSDLPRKKPR